MQCHLTINELKFVKLQQQQQQQPTTSSSAGQHLDNVRGRQVAGRGQGPSCVKSFSSARLHATFSIIVYSTIDPENGSKCQSQEADDPPTLASEAVSCQGAHKAIKLRFISEAVLKINYAGMWNDRTPKQGPKKNSRRKKSQPQRQQNTEPASMSGADRGSWANTARCQESARLCNVKHFARHKRPEQKLKDKKK